LQWLQDPSEINGDNLNNVRCEGSRYFRNKKREYLKDKINELARNSKNKIISDLYRRISGFKRDYQQRNNLVKDENGDLVADSHNTLNRRMGWVGHVARMGEKRIMYRLLVEKPERKRPLGRPRCRWLDNIRMDLGEVGSGDVDWISLTQDRNRWRGLRNSVLNFRIP
jgi:hypothetical protein